MIYDYLCEKPWVKTYMTVRPQKALAAKHITGMGFHMETYKKDKKILLDVKEEDWRCKLVLAYYSLSLTPALLIEGCISTLIKSRVSTGSYEVGKESELAPMLKVVQIYADLFKNELMVDLEAGEQQIMQRVMYFVDRGHLEVSENKKTVRVANTPNSITLIDFFSKLVVPLIDTYLITLMMIDNLNGKNLVIKVKTLVKELHVGIKYLYSQGCIPMLHSCLKETIMTALSRFMQMGLLQYTAYLTKKGNSTIFMRAPSESQSKVRELLDRLQKDRNFDKNHQD